LEITLSDKNANCYVCGSDNPLGLHVPFSPFGEGGSRATYTVRPEHTGWQGFLHGGLAFTLMDEALGWALYFQNMRGVTAKSEVRFRAPIPVGAQLVITASILNKVRRLVTARAEVRRVDENDALLVELKATLYLMKLPPPKSP